MFRSPVRAVLAVAFIVLMAWTIQAMFHTTYFTVVAVLLVWGQVAGFFLPTRFSLTDEKISVRGLVSRREKNWSEFRSHYIDREGVLLSPFVESSSDPGWTDSEVCRFSSTATGTRSWPSLSA
jgi:uncharacterized membrane protein YdbT with pleckstrin-like domain